MSDTRKLLLRTTQDNKVHATITLEGDHVVVDGIKAARQIIDSFARTMGGSEEEAFNYLWRVGWANGPVALVPAGKSENESG